MILRKRKSCTFARRVRELVREGMPFHGSGNWEIERRRRTQKKPY